MKKNLVVVRAGKNSLHSRWLDLRYAARSFETLISFYDAEAFEAFVPQEGVQAILHQTGGKWDNIQRCLSGLDLHAYQYVWLPDDDVLIDGASVNKMFELAGKHGLTICQPALTRDSYFTFIGLIGADPFRVRYTNFVEVMAPCLHREVIAEVIDLFAISPSGFGLDRIWSRVSGAGRERVAILDCVRMRHTRPVGSALVKELAARGRDVEADLRHLADQFENYQRLRTICYAAIMADGSRLDGQVAVARRSAADWFAHRADFIDHKNIPVECLQVLKRHLIYQDGLATTLRRKAPAGSPAP